jgi:hypothetical protein
MLVTIVINKKVINYIILTCLSLTTLINLLFKQKLNYNFILIHTAKMKIRKYSALLYLLLLAALLTDLLFLDYTTIKPYEWVKMTLIIAAFLMALIQYYKERQREI